MAIKDVETKCYILALFIRNDGARFLLGSGAYEFKEGQQHFAANTMQNDVVEVQGNDGYLLAGQVRRPGAQSFDGYVGDSSTSKPVVEGLRRDFFQFFRKGYFYKVVYVFPDGSAIQRKRGFLVDAPVVQELYQIYPEYHVALNFEDINYYFYDENAEGEEIYGKSAIVGLSMATGGLVWDGDGAVTDPLTFGGVVTVKGAETINNLLNVAVPLASVEIDGDTYQQTYTGKNLFYTAPRTDHGITFSYNSTDGTTTFSGTPTDTYAVAGKVVTNIPSGTYTMSIDAPKSYRVDLGLYDSNNTRTYKSIAIGNTSTTFTLATDMPGCDVAVSQLTVGTPISGDLKLMLESGSTATSFEPYVGGTASPNPNYPQEVQTVTGEQTVTVSNGSQSQEYEVNLGKNLWGGFSADMPRSTSGIDFNNLANGDIVIPAGTTSNQANSLSSSMVAGTDRLLTLQAGTYTISGATGDIRVQIVNNVGTALATDTGGGATVTLSSVTQVFVRVSIDGGKTVTDTTIHPQLELGSTATPYAPYFTPIELCKISDYQDYIYKSGDDWYVHKETGKQVVDVSTIALRSNYSDVEYGVFNKPNDYGGYGSFGYSYPIVSTHAIFKNNPPSWNSASNIGGGYTGAATVACWIGFVKGTGLDNIKSALSGLTNYYALATPTDIQITDTTLIGQLDALGAAKLYVGENNLMVTASGTNLPAELEVGYYTEIEDGYGFVWEEGRSPSNIIAVDSIDDVFPVLTITGETENPILANVTTGTIFQYNGTITASQTLVVDMMNQTATLNGTSVIGNVTGDWVYFAPGNNRVSYTAGNANAPDATIEWQEIVG